MKGNDLAATQMLDERVDAAAHLRVRQDELERHTVDPRTGEQVVAPHHPNHTRVELDDAHPVAGTETETTQLARSADLVVQLHEETRRRHVARADLHPRLPREDPQHERCADPVLCSTLLRHVDRFG